MTHRPVDLSRMRLITVSGRIASGSTTLAHHLAATLGWRHIEGGEIFWEAVRRKMHLSEKDTNKRPDEEDRDFDESLKNILKTQSHLIVETKLAGFNAQGLEGIFKILVVCQDMHGVDQTNIRIDRLVNREHISIEEAKEEVLEREKNDLEKWQRLYANNNTRWVYWDERYYDLIINTYSHDQDQTLHTALSAIGFKNTVS
ncbi:MAG TPA: AAA family ATPase [Patescibacteria group bacterium]|nr:AAA family ATPase [Patescibacteria group bacterium]